MKEQSLGVYIKVLQQSLTKKNELLDQLLELTLQQEKQLKEVEFDFDAFSSLMDLKEAGLIEIGQIDEGFETTYSRIKDLLQEQKHLYREEIQTMQVLISELTDKGVKLQSLEIRNKQNMKLKTTTIRQKNKAFHVSNKTANQYYKNMANQHIGQSYFLDKKK